MDKRDKIITLCLISVTLVTGLLALPHPTTPISADDQKQLVVATNFFADVNIQAKAAYVYDLTTNKELFTKNETVPLPLASLTKIMTAVTASDLAPASTEVSIDAQSLKEEGDSGLYADEQWSLGKLLQYTLVASSNDGAAAVAASFGNSFVDSMNSKAITLGFNSMHFTNPSGLDESTSQAGAYGSAKDVAHLLAYALQHEPDVLEPTRYESFSVTSDSNFKHTAVNTDVLTNKIPSLIVGKTGYTDLAGGNLAVIFDAGVGHPIAVVVLGSTYDGRFDDVETLVHAAHASIVAGQ